VLGITRENITKDGNYLGKVHRRWELLGKKFTKDEDHLLKYHKKDGNYLG